EKSTTSARVQRAIARGFLINNEAKKGMPARIILGDPLPEERQILPDPKVLEEGCSGVRSKPEGVKGGGQVSGEAPSPEDGKLDKSPEVALKSTAKTEKQPEPVSLPKGALPAAPNIPAQSDPPENTSNTRTPPEGDNDHTVWPRAISNSPEDRQQLPPGAVFAKVVIREIWPPSLGPEGDDIYDINPPGWQH